MLNSHTLLSLFILIHIYNSFQLRSRILNTSPTCNGHGYFYLNRCFCQSQWKGEFCNQKSIHSWYNTDDKCDDLVTRLDNLVNISPEHYRDDDDEFPRLSGNSIGKGEAVYGDKGNTWIKMHDLAKSFRIYGDIIKPRDVHQGSLGNCYLLAAFSSMATIKNGQLIKDVFITKEDNEKHVYITRWLIDGRPRFVAVDQWIPGKSGNPSFSGISAQNDFWAIILEKAWAKINGNYMNTQVGSHLQVWEALTQAPTNTFMHNDLSGDEVFAKVKELLDNKFIVGAATVQNRRKNLVQHHAYSVLAYYHVKLDNGSIQNLIYCFNPLQYEKFQDNEWADSSSKWTDKVKSQVEWSNADDGAFYLNPTDYAYNFGGTPYAEFRENYEIAYQDIGLQEGTQDYRTEFVYTGPKQSIYVKIDTTTSRLIRGCQNTFQIHLFEVENPEGKTSYGNEMEIKNANIGKYKIYARVQKLQNFHRYFTFTIYALAKSIEFVAKNQCVSEKEDKKLKQCPNDCSDNGRCNTFNGICTCYFGFEGEDCSRKLQIACPDNCNNHGDCNRFGECKCHRGYDGKTCLPCKDLKVERECLKYYNEGYCDEKSDIHEFMQKNCRYTCGSRSFKGFGTCQLLGEKCEGVKCGIGECEPKTGQCNCPQGYIGTPCRPCEDKTGTCRYWSQNGYCEKDSRFYSYMKDNCLKSCGELLTGFGSCSKY